MIMGFRINVTRTGAMLGFVMFFSLCSGCSWAVQNGESMDAGKYFTNDDVKSLAISAANGEVDNVKYLVKKGVNVNSIGREDMTPLIFALINGNKDGVSALLDSGANPNLIATNGASMVVLSAITEDDYYLKDALSHGGNPNILDPKGKRTALVQSIFYNKVKNAQLLLEGGADVNGVYAEGDDLPILIAASADKYDFVVLFLEYMNINNDKMMTDKTIKDLLFYINDSNLMSGTDAYAWKEKAKDILLKEYSRQ